jgi:hypothetical protein
VLMCAVLALPRTDRSAELSKLVMEKHSA